MQRKMTVVDIQRFQRSKKARERWRRNLKTLRLLCGVCIACKKSLESVIPSDSWQSITTEMKKKVKKNSLQFDTAFFRSRTLRTEILNRQQKHILTSKPDVRQDEDIIAVVRGLQALEEFTFYSKTVQYDFAKYAFLETYGPNRVIFKEQHRADFLYIVIRGTLIYRNASETTVIGKGEKIGEDEIIGSRLRGGTLTTQSDEVQLLSLHKEHFDEITIAENQRGTQLRDIIGRSSVLKLWPTRELLNRPQDWIIRNYKADSWISEDLWNDDWVYIVKSGFCVVAKGMDELEMHLHSHKKKLRRKRREKMKEDLIHRKLGGGIVQSSNAFRPLQSRGMAPRDWSSQRAMHEMDSNIIRELRAGKNNDRKWFIAKELNPGDVAAVDSLTDTQNQINPRLALVTSQGTELLQIKRKTFQRFISADLNSLLTIMSNSYPSFDDLQRSRNHHIEWQMYKAAVLAGAMKPPKSHRIKLQPLSFSVA